MNSAPTPHAAADPRRALAALMPDLRAFARFLLRDRAAADDLVHDAVVRALAALDQYVDGTNFRNWLFAIVRNTHYEQSRRRRTEQRILAARGPDADSAPAHQPDEAAIAELQRFLWQLPTNLREALVLVGAQGLSYQEAATVCGVAEGTLKARVSRGRAELGRLMGEGRQARPGALPLDPAGA